MQKTAEEFSQEFRRDCGWMPEQVLQNLQKDVDDIQGRFLAGVSMQDQCRMMKQEAMAAAISRQHQNRPRKETAWEDAWNAPTIPPWDQGRVPARPAKAECHQKKAECRFLTALLLARKWCNKKPGPGLFLLLILLLGFSRVRCLNQSRWQKAPPTARFVKPQPMPKKATSCRSLWSRSSKVTKDHQRSRRSQAQRGRCRKHPHLSCQNRRRNHLHHLHHLHLKRSSSSNLLKWCSPSVSLPVS